MRSDEIRLIFIQDLDSALKSESKSIAIGLEYCSRFISEKKRVLEALELIINNQKQPVLVTPSVCATEFNLIKSVVLGALAKYPDLQIVFNDFGLLRTITNSFKHNQLSTWWAGRLISRGMSDWPWFETILRSEREDVYNGFLSSSTNHPEIVSLLKMMGIGGVEINNTRLNEKNCQQIKEYGFKTKIHIGPKLLAVSRSCIELRDKVNSGRSPFCNGTCTKKFELKLHSLESSSVPLDSKDKIQGTYPELMVVGAGIFEKNFNSLLQISRDYVDETSMTIF